MKQKQNPQIIPLQLNNFLKVQKRNVVELLLNFFNKKINNHHFEIFNPANNPTIIPGIPKIAPPIPAKKPEIPSLIFNSLFLVCNLSA